MKLIIKITPYIFEVEKTTAALFDITIKNNQEDYLSSLRINKRKVLQAIENILDEDHAALHLKQNSAKQLQFDFKEG